MLPIRQTLAGFTFVEAVLCLMIMLAASLLFSATFPLALRSAAMSNNYAQAKFLADHKIDELRAAGWSNVVQTNKFTGAPGITDVANTAQLEGLSDIDASPGTGPAWTFTTIDNLPSYFGSGCAGTVTIVPDTVETYCRAGSTSCELVDVTVKISWSSGLRNSGSYQAYAIISNPNP